MRRVGNLYHQISEPENLRLAFWKAAKGKRHRQEVIVFQENYDQALAALRHGLRANAPTIGQYRFFYVHDPKKRLICAASFPERVLHHAVMNICEPLLDTYAISDTYACRKGKGMRAAIIRGQELARQCRWYLKLDVRKYFDSIDHEIMLALLARRFKDKDLLYLFRQLLDTYQVKPGCGLPIGNLISQHLANFYLGAIDHWLKEERGVRHYVRYMDDMLLGAMDKEQLSATLILIHDFLRQRLRLELKASTQLNRCELGIPFLGFRVFPGKIMLAPGSKRRFARRFRVYEKMWQSGAWSEIIAARRVEALIDFTRIATAKGFRAKVIARSGVSS